MKNTNVKMEASLEDTQEMSALAPIENRAGEETRLLAAPVVLDAAFYAQCNAAIETLEQDYTQGALKEISESQSYFEFEVQGQHVLGVFIRIINLYIPDEVTGEIRALPSIVWMGLDKKLYCNSGVVLVRHFYDQYNNVYLIQPGSRVKITYEGKKGKSKIYSVSRLIDPNAPF